MVWKITDVGKKIVLLLKENERSLGYLYAVVDCSPKFIDNNMLKLEQQEIVNRYIRANYTYFCLNEKYTDLFKERIVRCPKCRRKKSIHDSRQIVTACMNKKCLTPSGQITRFWVRNRDRTQELNNP